MSDHDETQHENEFVKLQRGELGYVIDSLEDRQKKLDEESDEDNLLQQSIDSKRKLRKELGDDIYRETIELECGRRHKQSLRRAHLAEERTLQGSINKVNAKENETNCVLNLSKNCWRIVDESRRLLPRSL